MRKVASPETWTRSIPRSLFPGKTDPLTEAHGLPGRPPTAHAAVLGALRAGALTVDEIRHQLGWQRRSRARVRASITWLEARGWVEPCWRPIKSA